MLLIEDKEHRDELFDGLLKDRFSGGYPHQHELWPCVRLGLAQRWLKKLGVKFTSRRRALYYLRGNSAESLIIGARNASTHTAFVYRGVIVRPDWWLNEDALPFAEIKSTALSSYRIWELMQKYYDPEKEATNIPILQGEDFPFRGYIDQSAIYCVATGTPSCRLIVYFLHGDYAERRSKCPECGERFPQKLVDDLYKLCPRCGFKSYAIDVRSYQLHFTPEEIAWYEREVYDTRAPMFVRIWQALTRKGRKREPEALIREATPTPNFFCDGCEAGRLIGCEHYKGDKRNA